MYDDEQNDDSLEETLRSIARELGRSVERMTDIDVEEVARTIGVDPLSAQQWVQSASSWLRGQVENVGEDLAARAGRAGQPAPGEDPLSRAEAHPLDLPSEEQGLALAALDSGRWTIEAGSDALAAHGDGPGPSNALGLVRELRVRDWISREAELTLAGRHALRRWLETAPGR